MVSAPRPYWFDSRQPDARWLSTGVSIAVTVGVFAMAFASMRSTSQWAARRFREEPPVMVPLTLPSPPTETRPRPTPKVAPKVAPPATVPTETVPTTAAPATVPAPAAPAVQRVDTTNARGTATDAPAEAAARPTVRGAAPFAPAGVTSSSRAPLTPEARASILAARPMSMLELARKHPPTGQDLADLQYSQRHIIELSRRVGTAGNADVHVPVGEGRDGVGAVGGGLSSSNVSSSGVHVPLTLFSSGPTAAQRKRDSIIDADNRARLDRFAAAIATRDSVRADSLRRDSLARRRVVP